MKLIRLFLSLGFGNLAERYHVRPLAKKDEAEAGAGEGEQQRGRDGGAVRVPGGCPRAGKSAEAGASKSQNQGLTRLCGECYNSVFDFSIFGGKTMSGHSKWHNIQAKKGKADAQRGAVFTKIGREIAIAVREGGANPESNGKLRISSPRPRPNMPNDNIQRSIKRPAAS